jgi:hypothetical protein
MRSFSRHPCTQRAQQNSIDVSRVTLECSLQKRDFSATAEQSSLGRVEFALSRTRELRLTINA